MLGTVCGLAHAECDPFFRADDVLACANAVSRTKPAETHHRADDGSAAELRDDQRSVSERRVDHRRREAGFPIH